jgi:hypothetical protein
MVSMVDKRSVLEDPWMQKPNESSPAPAKFHTSHFEVESCRRSHEQLHSGALDSLTSKLHMPPRFLPSPVIGRALLRASRPLQQRNRISPLTFNFSHKKTMHQQAMDQATLKQYLADDPPTIVPLAIKPHFDALQPKEKKYAHYISRAALAGTRINLRQVSAESEAIYDFIIELHRCENGEWRWISIHAGDEYHELLIS